jgi:hypothetical protein
VLPGAECVFSCGTAFATREYRVGSMACLWDSVTRVAQCPTVLPAILCARLDLIIELLKGSAIGLGVWSPSRGLECCPRRV